ncbi:MAG: sigma-54-dependent Fis family transcriptional regulator [Deltaproteobacteria bacterium]|nr:sigma-54-dependent Fis family transcriptional regulator [Deltaproteobacteria bacterium]MBW1983889.1 sigma-54-dependent Fis family transcriptional regulator [Deltaproteobacteria bacterium]MBW2179306.1 sigma-54-dependent Fis family transcriptional regulator [Deltaproteobacteria bacterium]
MSETLGEEKQVVTSSAKRMLIVDDEKNMRHMLTSMLGTLGYVVDTAADGTDALKMVNHSQYDFILCDLKMPNMDGMAFLEAAREKLLDTTVIMMSAYGTIDTAVEAMKRGAYDYISKPFKTDEVFLTLKKAEERENLKKENVRLKKRIRKIEHDYSFAEMVATSRSMKDVFELVRKVAGHKTTVLISGESGTGKELVARSIHEMGDRSDKPLVTVNCGGIPETLLESELFGYKKGAFTGADRDKKGLFEEADAGTIFLDEIGEMPQPLQVKLLRVLQGDEIRSVGDSKTQKIDVRVIAATSKNLKEEAAKGHFREDLFYRLNVLQISIPPLRERPEDIPVLCQHFINTFNSSLNKKIKSITPASMSIIRKHQWPGNVRELENIIEHAIVVAEGNRILPENLPPEFISESEKKDDNTMIEGNSLKDAQKALEKKLITKVLTETGGNRTRAAKILEISHPSLLSKIKTYRIQI